MELTFETLIQFDLLERFEKNLPPENALELTTEYFGIVQKIQSVDQFIKETPSFPGSTDKIIREELVSAIGSTLAIEGTSLEKDEIEESFRKAGLNEKLKRKEQEAENSRKVYEFIMHLVRVHRDGFAFDEQVIRQIHTYFTGGMNYLSNTPGEYRDFTVTFGSPRREGLCKTRSEIDLAMSKFAAWLNTDAHGFFSSNIIAKAIMAHYYLTEIHPFGDGNGRTARALEALALYLKGVNDYCFWSLANFWSMHRDEYLVQLGNVRSTGNPWDFLIWGMNGYFEELMRIKGLVLKKLKQLMIMDYAKYLLANKRNEEVKLNQRIVDVLRLLIPTGRVPLDKFQSSPEVNALYSNVSSTTKYRDFKKMVIGGLIRLHEEEGVFYIEPNYRILETLRYNV